MGMYLYGMYGGGSLPLYNILVSSCTELDYNRAKQQLLRGPKGPRFTVRLLVFGNLINLKEFAKYNNK